MRLIAKQLLVLVLLLLSVHAWAQNTALKASAPRFVFNQSDVTVKLNAFVDEIPLVGVHVVNVNGQPKKIDFKNGKASLDFHITKTTNIEIALENYLAEAVEVKIKKYPAFLTIIPPLVAIVLAIVFQEVISALFIGILIGVVLYLGFDMPVNWLRAPLVFIHHYILKVLTHPEKISVIVFSMLIGGMVNLLIKNGSMHHLVLRLSKVINSRRKALFSTWFLGIIIFFDDYANTLVVGNSIRPLTDKFKVSREKLAYIVDSTAAPVASIALITTWIGAQVNYISDAVVKLGIDENPYMIFLNSIPYAFYPILTILFMGMLIYAKKDFGPMLKAENEAQADFTKSLEVHSYGDEKLKATYEYDPQKQTSKWWEAVLPIFTLMLVAFFSLLLYKGSMVYWQANESFGLRFIKVIGAADAFKSLLFASFSGMLMAVFLSLLKNRIGLKKSIEAILGGFRTMVIAMVILILAWSLGMITEDLGTDLFLTDMIGSHVSPYMLSALIFIASALISFATGSSWGTMALLYPMMLPMVYLSSTQAGLSHAESMRIFYMAISAVLGGSVFGDHCSPISDTTIMSSMSSQCNHIQHVRTQMPYAITVAVVSILFGYIAISHLNISPLWVIGLAVVVFYLLIKFYAKKSG